jgi:hypothetical protein
MKQLNEFIKTSLIGGIVVVLPVAILIRYHPAPDKSHYKNHGTVPLTGTPR